MAVPRDSAEPASPIPLGGRSRIACSPAPGGSPGVAVCAGAGLAVAAGESLFVVYGAWLTRDFGMSVAQIGASTLLIVAAELVGGGIVVAVSDRVGLRRTLFSALLVSATMYVALGLIGRRVGLAFAAVTMLFVAFEVAIVVWIALASTIVHRGRTGIGCSVR